MKVIYENKFLKDLKYLDSKNSLKLKNIILKIEVTKNLSDLDNIKKWFDLNSIIELGSEIID